MIRSRFNKLSPRRQGVLLGALATALVIAIFGIAIAATSTNIIYGCYEKRGGELRVRKAGAKCKAGEVAIAWNKRGPRGPRGIQGIQGEPGIQGEQGEPGLLASFDQVDGLACTRLGQNGTINTTLDGEGFASFKCELTLCGNNTIDTGEECDTGGPSPACTDTCQVPPPAQCGNGTVDFSFGESCDDGDTVGSDGCDAACQVEAGYQCSGSPSVCTTTCGDGVIAGGEQCDDGNSVDNDACSNACSVNPPP